MPAAEVVDHFSMQTMPPMGLWHDAVPSRCEDARMCSRTSSLVCTQRACVPTIGVGFLIHKFPWFHLADFAVLPLDRVLIDVSHCPVKTSQNGFDNSSLIHS